MTDREIKHSIDLIFEQLRAQVAKYAQDAGRFEALADSYWGQLVAMRDERDQMETRLNALLDDIGATFLLR